MTFNERVGVWCVWNQCWTGWSGWCSTWCFLSNDWQSNFTLVPNQNTLATTHSTLAAMQQSPRTFATT